VPTTSPRHPETVKLALSSVLGASANGSTITAELALRISRPTVAGSRSSGWAAT
jgi:hypothetical protein